MAVLVSGVTTPEESVIQGLAAPVAIWSNVPCAFVNGFVFGSLSCSIATPAVVSFKAGTFAAPAVVLLTTSCCA